VPGVRANWFVDDLNVATDDPFLGDPEEDGQPIELGGDLARLGRRLVELAHQEQTLATAGVTCPIKDRPDTCCSACPVRGSDEALSSLCDVGQEQERVCTRLAVAREHSGHEPASS
jgi:hypothetical protein